MADGSDALPTECWPAAFGGSMRCIGNPECAIRVSIEAQAHARQNNEEE